MEAERYPTDYDGVLSGAPALQWGFDTFSHRKSVLRRPKKYADPPALKPPYKRWKQWLSRRTF